MKTQMQHGGSAGLSHISSKADSARYIYWIQENTALTVLTLVLPSLLNTVVIMLVSTENASCAGPSHWA